MGVLTATQRFQPIPGPQGPWGPGAVYLRLLLTDSVLLREQNPRRLGGYGNSFRSILL